MGETKLMPVSGAGVRYSSFPRTQPPPAFIPDVVAAFREYDEKINTVALVKGLTSDGVLSVMRDRLIQLNFEVETGKRQGQKIKRPVYFGENGQPKLQYEIDAYQPQWRCGLEIEAGRAWMGNAIYRDLIQALIMVNLDHLILAVPNAYKYQTNNKTTINKDYDYTVAVADAIYGHSRIKMPFTLTVVGY
jgi:hypothetical protein